MLYRIEKLASVWKKREKNTRDALNPGQGGPQLVQGVSKGSWSRFWIETWKLRFRSAEMGWNCGHEQPLATIGSEEKRPISQRVMPEFLFALIDQRKSALISHQLSWTGRGVHSSFRGFSFPSTSREFLAPQTRLCEVRGRSADHISSHFSRFCDVSWRSLGFRWAISAFSRKTEVPNDRFRKGNSDGKFLIFLEKRDPFKTYRCLFNWRCSDARENSCRPTCWCFARRIFSDFRLWVLSLMQRSHRAKLDFFFELRFQGSRRIMKPAHP